MLLLKVCGMRDSKNIAELVLLQPDMIGFIFHEASPRNVTELPNIELPKSIKKVGVFVDENETFINQKVKQFNLDMIQLHGYESPKFCEKIQSQSTSIIKAFNIHKGFDFEVLSAYEPFCDYFLFDAFGKNAGGNGIVFDWKLLEKYTGDIPFILSGGIDETLIETIKKIKHPKMVGIDINSKFEMAAAYKNIGKVRRFKNELYS